MTYENPACGGYYTGSADWIACINQYCFGDLNGPQCVPYTITQTITIVEDDPSDGLLCRYTQIMPGVPINNVYEAEGVNHAEETNTTSKHTLNNNDEMQDIFNEIWNRNDLFETAFR